ncbi:alkaline phosphatase family protein [Mucilaginibacter aquaedulcis]|uniref:alkaline phosphatase family protein n=1 Tax=Mucilaginibacter aquaedulcis TaxID=1187081 RepID=UPI0025B3CAE1|nr:alkaline phosphatase family protein [Mucilaginibacter aquaedulcis]MDN3548670.1 DUF4983 domain-containing protein [Mucilaginibacter aquaedulcis]
MWNRYKGIIFSVIFALAAAAISCNKDFVRTLPNKDYTDTAKAQFGDRKVLYLIVDGARGASVNSANIPNIKALLPNSIYSWVALSDPDSTRDVSNWANMLTGVKKDKHKVLSDDFAGNNLETYPVFFQRIKEEKPNAKIVSFSSSAIFKDKLTQSAAINQSFDTDEQIKAALVNNLNTDTAQLILGHFNDIDEAGARYGYDNSRAQYKASIEKFDGYVGEIIDALKKRKNFDKEDWLVVIASSGGGKFDIPANQNDNTVFSNTSANTFTIYYNPKYRQRILAKPFTGNRYLGRTIRFKDSSVRAQIDTADIFNLDDTTKFTIELKVKKNEDKFFWPSILGKRKEWSSGHPGVGWVIYLEDSYWYFEMRGTNDNDFRQCRGGDLQKGRWQTLTAKCEIRAGKRYIRTYTDGIFNNELEVTTSGSFSNNSPLKLGYLNGTGHGTPDVYVSDIRFFKVDVPDAVIGNYACETSITEGHPYYSFLAAYWPGTDGQGDKIRDIGPQARDFQLKGNFNWEDFNDLICPPPTEALATFVPQTADIPAQIINWFRIPNRQSWGLDGRVWLDQ